MSPRDHDEPEGEDRVAHARRGLLSASEQAALAKALERDATLRAAYRVGVELDRAGAVQGGDDALIASAAEQAIARAAEMTSRTRAAHASANASAQPADPRRASVHVFGKTRWAAAAAVGLSLIFASGIATALFTGAMPWPFPRASSAPERQPEHSAAPKAKRPRRDTARVQPAQSLVPAVPVPLAPAEERGARKPGVRGAEHAAELFHDANNARRDGDLPRARRLYAQLIAAHPGSDEAGLSRVSLGRLLLAAGDARGAEREFRRYLAAGAGQLHEEALVGQAQSLHGLGRQAEERAAWKRLLAAHPSSVYAAEAEQRLAELRGAADEAAR